MTLDEAANILNVRKNALAEDSELQKMLKVNHRAAPPCFLALVTKQLTSDGKRTLIICSRRTTL